MGFEYIVHGCGLVGESGHCELFNLKQAKMRAMRRVSQYMYHLDAYNSLSFVETIIPLFRWKWYEFSTSFVNHI
jgi:hypothetical protein